mgnify:CR=1 FL=1
MAKSFELETLQMRLNDAQFQRLGLHQRIQRALRALILDGALSPGLKLPATRVLATSLGVARDTVENAYVQLHRDGFIVRREGSGSYVCEAIGTPWADQELAEFRSKAAQYRSSLGLLQQELNMSQPLVASGAIAEVEMLRLRRSAVEGQMRTRELEALDLPKKATSQKASRR